jgi:hypothetical protein
MCRPGSCGIAGWAARWLHKILLLPVWVGQPSEGQALPCPAMVTIRRQNSKWKECSTLSFTRQDKNIFTPLHIKLGLIKR